MVKSSSKARKTPPPAERLSDDLTPTAPAARQQRAQTPPPVVARQTTKPAKTAHPLRSGVQDETIDRQVHAALARMTSGLSPVALMAAYNDWAGHLAISPG